MSAQAENDDESVDYGTTESSQEFDEREQQEDDENEDQPERPKAKKAFSNVIYYGLIATIAIGGGLYAAKPFIFKKTPTVDAGFPAMSESAAVNPAVIAPAPTPAAVEPAIDPVTMAPMVAPTQQQPQTPQNAVVTPSADLAPQATQPTTQPPAVTHKDVDSVATAPVTPETTAQTSSETDSRLEKRIADLEDAVAKLKSAKGNSGTISHNRKLAHKTNKSPEKAKAVDSGYTLKAIVPGRAWLIARDGSQITVAEGDTIPGAGRIVSILAEKGEVKTSMGGNIQ